MAGRGKKQFTQEEFMQFCLDYFDHIFLKQNDEDAVSEPPTFYGLYRFIKGKKDCSYRTIRRCFDEYWTDIKKEFEAMRADLLIRGSAIGQYNSTITIFALKNWCHWKDNPVDMSLNNDNAHQDELSKSLEEMAKGLESDD